jgi:hypothetical protein
MGLLGRAVRAGLALAVIALAGGRAAAVGFESHVMRLPFALEQDAVPIHLSSRSHRDVAAFGEIEPGRLHVAIFTRRDDGTWPTEPDRIVPVPDAAVAYDVGPAPGGPLEAFYFLTSAGIVSWDAAAEPVRVADATSLYRRRPEKTIPEIDFLRDIEGDGDLDLLLPDFDAYRVARSEGARFEQIRALPIPADVQRLEERLAYAPVRLELRDVTLDGQADAVFLAKGELRVHPSEAGRIAADPLRVALPIEVTDPPERGEMTEVDQRDQTWTYLLGIDDFDGDGVVDLFTQKVRSEGVFDKRHTLALHRGRRNGAAIAFAPEPDTRIESTVVVGEPVIEDIDRDGRLDVALGSVDFGLGALVSALLTGTIDVDVAVHRLGANGRFEEQPSAREEITIDVDLTSGRTTIPLAELADVDGDGRKDLLIGEGTKSIRVHRGTEGSRSFAAEPVQYETTLPGNGGLATVEDLDGDGREDLILRYGKLDDPGLVRTLRVLVAR